jgi:hypothetical protein
MGRSRGTLTRKGRNNRASHALYATAPALYSTVEQTLCMEITNDGVKKNDYGLLSILVSVILER